MGVQIKKGKIWGIVPAAGMGSRIQPLAFSKELLPVGSRLEGQRERPRAVAEYLVERMVKGGASRICFTIAPGKSDILSYFGSSVWGADIVYAVQPRPAGLCDAIFRAIPLVTEDDTALVGLPDTIWYPDDGFCNLPDGGLSFLLFSVDRPQLFDAVTTDGDGRVTGIEVKAPAPRTTKVWGAFKLDGRTLRVLHELWRRRAQQDEYFGTLVAAYLRTGADVRAVTAGGAYVDVGTVHGYREAIALLEQPPVVGRAAGIRSNASTGTINTKESG